MRERLAAEVATQGHGALAAGLAAQELGALAAGLAAQELAALAAGLAAQELAALAAGLAAQELAALAAGLVAWQRWPQGWRSRMREGMATGLAAPEREAKVQGWSANWSSQVTRKAGHEPGSPPNHSGGGRRGSGAEALCWLATADGVAGGTGTAGGMWVLPEAPRNLPGASPQILRGETPPSLCWSTKEMCQYVMMGTGGPGAER